MTSRRTVELRLVSPAEAQAWLDTSPQRRFDQDRVDRLVALIESGQWAPEDHAEAPVHLADRLGNGNHRLRAIVQHGRPTEMWVMTDG